MIFNESSSTDKVQCSLQNWLSILKLKVILVLKWVNYCNSIRIFRWRLYFCLATSPRDDCQHARPIGPTGSAGKISRLHQQSGSDHRPVWGLRFDRVERKHSNRGCRQRLQVQHRKATSLGKEANFRKSRKSDAAISFSDFSAERYKRFSFLLYPNIT